MRQVYFTTTPLTEVNPAHLRILLVMVSDEAHSPTPGLRHLITRWPYVSANLVHPKSSYHSPINLVKVEDQAFIGVLPVLHKGKISSTSFMTNISFIVDQAEKMNASVHLLANGELTKVMSLAGGAVQSSNVPIFIHVADS